MKRNPTAITLAAVLGLLVAGCSQVSNGGTSEPNATVSIWKAPHSNDDATFFEDVMEVASTDDAFPKTDYRVTPWDTWQETYTSAFAGSTPPDVHYNIGQFFTKFAESGQLLALDDAYPDELAALKDDFDQSIWDLASVDGQVYGVPFIQAGISFVWNKDLFESAGLDPETPPADWDEVKDFAAAITEANPGSYGYGIIDNSTGQMLSFYPSILANYGAEFENAAGEWTLDSPEASEGLQVLVDMYADGSMPPFGTFAGADINTAFLDGRIGMMLTYSSFITGSLGDYPDLNLGVGRPPCGPANCDSFGDIGFWSIAEKSPNKDAAWKVVEALVTEEVSTGYAQLTGLFPARTGSVPFADDAVLQSFQDTQGGFMSTPRRTFDYWSILTPAVEQAISGQVPADEALRAASDQIRAKQ